MYYQLSFFVPESHAEMVKTALFEKGAGQQGPYDCCAWQVLGQGQFRPLEDSDPYSGEVGQIEKASEYKVEMVCAPDIIETVIDELKRAHPYEEPAYSVVKLEEF